MVSRQRGDTLVEVLLSIVILGVIIVGAISIMSRGLSASQVSLEHTQVRLAINGQIELLRLVRDEYIKNSLSGNGLTWDAIATPSNTNPIVYNDSCSVSATKASSSFYLTQGATRVDRNAYTGATAPLLPAPGQGMWIETRRSTSAIKYIDFVVRACWQGSGAAGTQRTVTAVRFYDPKP